jgi:hypothetical protein
MTKEPKSKLGKLQFKFQNSGLREHPIITDDELSQLSKELNELSLYMEDRNDLTMVYSLLLERESVEKIIWNRQF